MEKRWAYKERGEKEIVSSLAKQLCVGKNNAGNDDLFTYEIVAELLVQRGITTYEEAERFFRPKYEYLHDPYLMNDMDKAVERIQYAVDNKQYSTCGKGSYAETFPSYLTTLAEVVDKHQSGDCEQVEDMHTDTKTHQVGDKHNPTQRVALVSLLLPAEHKPNHKGGKH